MAEKSFGVKEVNLIGASGTPTITSPNNLNLNAVNVAISTNVSIGGTLSVTGNVSVGGTLTYEDVTNIDSVGIVTAREGVFIPDNKELKIGNTSSSPDLKIFHDESNSFIKDQGTGGLIITTDALQIKDQSNSTFALTAVPTTFVKLFYNGSNKLETTTSGINVVGTTTTGQLAVTGVSTFSDVIVGSGKSIQLPLSSNTSSFPGAIYFGDTFVQGTEGARIYQNTSQNTSFEFYRLFLSGDRFSVKASNGITAMIEAYPSASNGVSLYNAGSKKLQTTGGGITVTGGGNFSGIVTASTFSGSGASLTNLPLSNTDVQVLYTVTANGSSAYRFAGNGIVSTEDNPDVYLIRGLKYRFVNNSGGSHPFQIRESSGGSAYSAGVTNNGASSGNIDFQVPYSAPSHLYYQCTSHGGMVGNLYIRGAGGQNTNVGVTTFSGDVYLGNDIYLTDGSGGYEQVEVAANDIRVEHKHIHSEFDVWVRSTSVTDRKNGIVGDGNDLLLYSNTTSKVRITSDGDMGLGTGSNTVTQRLDVRESNSTTFNPVSSLPTIARLYNTSSTNGASAGLQLRTDNNNGAAGIQYIHAVNSSTNYDSDLVFSRRLATSGSYAEACRITNAGNLKFPSGNGIDFSATGDGGTASSELFDDYEEGSFTPGSNATLSTAAGFYTKIGRQVTLHIRVTVASQSSGSPFEVNNFPFTAGMSGTTSNGAVPNGFGYISSGSVIPQIHHIHDGTKAQFYNFNNFMTISNFSGKQLRFGLIYYTA